MSREDSRREARRSIYLLVAVTKLGHEMPLGGDWMPCYIIPFHIVVLPRCCRPAGAGWRLGLYCLDGTQRIQQGKKQLHIQYHETQSICTAAIDTV